MFYLINNFVFICGKLCLKKQQQRMEIFVVSYDINNIKFFHAPETKIFLAMFKTAKNLLLAIGSFNNFLVILTNITENQRD